MLVLILEMQKHYGIRPEFRILEFTVMLFSYSVFSQIISIYNIFTDSRIVVYFFIIRDGEDREVCIARDNAHMKSNILRSLSNLEKYRTTYKPEKVQDN